MPGFSARSEQGGPPAKTRLPDVFALVSDPDVSDAELRLWLHYPAAIDRLARIRLANRLASTRASDDGAA